MDTNLMAKFYGQAPWDMRSEEETAAFRRISPGQQALALVMCYETLKVPGLWQVTNYQETLRAIL